MTVTPKTVIPTGQRRRLVVAAGDGTNAGWCRDSPPLARSPHRSSGRHQARLLPVSWDRLVLESASTACSRCTPSWWPTIVVAVSATKYPMVTGRRRSTRPRADRARWSAGARVLDTGQPYAPGIREHCEPGPQCPSQHFDDTRSARPTRIMGREFCSCSRASGSARKGDIRCGSSEPVRCWRNGARPVITCAMSPGAPGDARRRQSDTPEVIGARDDKRDFRLWPGAWLTGNGRGCLGDDEGAQRAETRTPVGDLQPLGPADPGEGTTPRRDCNGR